MICEVIRGLTFAARIAEKAEKCAKRNGFACDKMPCFKDRDDEDNDDDDEEEGRGCDKAPCRKDRDDDDDDDDDDEDEVVDVKAVVVKEEKKEPEKKVESMKKSAPAKKPASAKKTASARKSAPPKAALKTEDKKDDKE